MAISYFKCDSQLAISQAKQQRPDEESKGIAF
jgi:hypothetical protein